MKLSGTYWKLWSSENMYIACANFDIQTDRYSTKVTVKVNITDLDVTFHKWNVIIPNTMMH